MNVEDLLDLIIIILPLMIIISVVATILSLVSSMFDEKSKPKERKIKEKKKKYECICGNKWKSRSNICPECNNVGWDIGKWVTKKEIYIKGVD